MSCREARGGLNGELHGHPVSSQPAKLKLTLPTHLVELAGRELGVVGQVDALVTELSGTGEENSGAGKGMSGRDLSLAQQTQFQHTGRYRLQSMHTHHKSGGVLSPPACQFRTHTSAGPPAAVASDNLIQTPPQPTCLPISYTRSRPPTTSILRYSSGAMRMYSCMCAGREHGGGKRRRGQIRAEHAGRATQCRTVSGSRAR